LTHSLFLCLFFSLCFCNTYNLRTTYWTWYCQPLVVPGSVVVCFFLSHHPSSIIHHPSSIKPIYQTSSSKDQKQSNIEHCCIYEYWYLLCEYHTVSFIPVSFSTSTKQHQHQHLYLSIYLFYITKEQFCNNKIILLLFSFVLTSLRQEIYNQRNNQRNIISLILSILK
jgi:hypothetical protein